jgi:hypothetical protein
MTDKKIRGSYWWVVTWDEYHIIRISGTGDTFTICGDGRHFSLKYIQKWISEIKNPVLENVVAEPARLIVDKCECDYKDDWFSGSEPMVYYCKKCFKEI